MRDHTKRSISRPWQDGLRAFLAEYNISGLLYHSLLARRGLLGVRLSMDVHRRSCF
jgi:hypothetical protein